MGHGNITFSDLKSIWRILASVVVCELLGGAITLFIGPHYSSFMKFSLGCGAGTFPGFAIGLAWQLKSSQDRRGWIGLACILGILSIAMTALTFVSDLPGMQSEMRSLEAIKQMQAEKIRQIDVFDVYGNEKIVSLTDTVSLNAFSRGIADAVGNLPNHPVYSQSWYVVVEGTTHHEFELHLDPEFPQSVIGDFVVKSGNTTWYKGTFESKSLRTWVEEHIMRGVANKRVKATR